MRKYNKYQNCLQNISNIILESAFSAKDDEKKSKNNHDDNLFESGRVMGFIEVIAIIQQTADAEGIDLKELDLDKIDPDNDFFNY